MAQVAGLDPDGGGNGNGNGDTDTAGSDGGDGVASGGAGDNGDAGEGGGGASTAAGAPGVGRGAGGDGDGGGRGLELLEQTDESVQEYAYLFVPGLFSQYSPQIYFHQAVARFREDLQVETRLVGLDSEASVEANAATLQEMIVRVHTETGKKAVLVGHSKGSGSGFRRKGSREGLRACAVAVSLHLSLPSSHLFSPDPSHPSRSYPSGGLDAAAAVTVYPEVQDLVAGSVFSQSPYGGAPVASDMLVDEAIAGPVEYLLENVLVRFARRFLAGALADSNARAAPPPAAPRHAHTPIRSPRSARSSYPHRCATCLIRERTWTPSTT